MLLLWVISWVFVARWIPPPSPNDSAAQVVQRFQDDTELIQVGMLITLFASTLLIPFYAVIAAHMRRIEGYGGCVLSTTQLDSPPAGSAPQQSHAGATKRPGHDAQVRPPTPARPSPTPPGRTAR